MHRITRGFAVATGVALLATGCGGGDSTTSSSPSASAAASASPSEPGATARSDADLVVWTDDEHAEATRAVAEGFGEDNGISVAVQAVPNGELQTTFVTANTAGNGPDVVLGAHDWIGNMVQNGAIDPLQLTPDQVGAYDPIALQATTYGGQLYGLPYGLESLVLYRNTDVVPDAPANLDDAIAAGEAAVAAGQVESAFNLQQGALGDAYHMQPLFTSAGGVVFGQDANGDADPTQLGLDQPGSIAAAQKIAELGEGGRNILRRSISADNSTALFTDGRAAFLISGPWARPDLDTAGLNYAVSPVPSFTGGQPAQPFTGVQAFYVASKGENKAFAQEFLASTVNTEEAQETMLEGTGLAPAMTSVQERIGAADPLAQAFITAAKSGTPMPSIPAMAAVWEPLGQAYASIIAGEDPTTTMQGAAQTINAAID